MIAVLFFSVASARMPDVRFLRACHCIWAFLPIARARRHTARMRHPGILIWRYAALTETKLGAMG